MGRIGRGRAAHADEPIAVDWTPPAHDGAEQVIGERDLARAGNEIDQCEWRDWHEPDRGHRQRAASDDRSAHAIKPWTQNMLDPSTSDRGANAISHEIRCVRALPVKNTLRPILRQLKKRVGERL
jgi:hypothetical protein